MTGKVYDPAAQNPLYNVAVYVPATPLIALPKGVPTGDEACSCDALFQSGALTNTTTAVDGTFTLANVPVGSSVPLVIQIGKWRRQVSINVTACQDNAQPDKSLAFLGTIPAGDTNDNMPDIAVSTGGADTRECLLSCEGGETYNSNPPVLVLPDTVAPPVDAGLPPPGSLRGRCAFQWSDMHVRHAGPPSQSIPLAVQRPILPSAY